MSKPQSFYLLDREREGQAGHLREVHKVTDELTDEQIVDRHHRLHTAVVPNGYYPEEHDRILSRLAGRLREHREQIAEQARLKVVKAALDGIDTYALVMAAYDTQDQPLVGTGDLAEHLAVVVKDRCPEAQAADFPNTWVKPRLDALTEQGKLVRYQAGRAGSLPLAIKGGYRSGSYYYGTQARIDATLAVINAEEVARQDRERRYAELGVDLVGLGITDFHAVQGGYGRPTSYRQVILRLEDVEALVAKVKG